MSKFEGPYGIVESDKLIPRWTFPVKSKGSVSAVESWELAPLDNTVSEVRTVRDIHTIHEQEVEDVSDAINLDEEATAFAKTESRLLIKPKLNKIRARRNENYVGPENVIDVDQEVIESTLDCIDENVSLFRHHFLNNILSPLLGYDIAAGESEAISRDCLETALEIDSELVPYMERIGLANIMGAMLNRSKDVPAEIKGDVIKDWLIKSFDDIRTKSKTHDMQTALRRLMNNNSDIYAKSPSAGIGTARGFSEFRKQQQDNGQA